MLEKIIRISIHNRLVTLAITALILVIGTVALFDTEVDIFPDLNAPVVTVMTEVKGYSPEEVEANVTFPIESAVSGAAGVRRVTSTSSPGFSAVRIEMDWGIDELAARQNVSERLTTLEGSLPAAADAPTLGPQSSILGEMMIIGLQSDTLSTNALRAYADKVLARRLQAIPGVAQVSVLGSAENRYEISLDPAKMAYHGLSPTEVKDALDQVNEDIGAGSVDLNGRQYLVKATVNNSSPEAIAATVIAPDRSPALTISDIGSVTIAPTRPATGSASVNCKPAVLLTVTKQHGVSTDKLTKNIDKLIANEASVNGKSITYNTDIFRQNDFINNSISNLQQSLLEGAAFVIIILFVFLMNVRTTLISLIALPVSIIITMLTLNIMGIGINTMTLGGIAIAIGSLVDDAIVDVENVYRHLRENSLLPASRRQAVTEVVRHASTEVRMPILNSSLIITASFLPLFFLTGMEGRMLIPLGVAFIIALAASTVVALTVTPALCVYLLGSEKGLKHTGTDKDPYVARKIKNLYARTLSAVTTPKGTRAVCGSTAALFVLAVVVFFTMGRGFMPPFNEGSFTINVASPAGSSLEHSDSVGQIAERIILGVPGITTTSRKTGRAELDEHSLPISMSEIEVPYKLTDGMTRASLADELRHRLSHIPGVVVEVGQPITHRLNAMMSGSQGQIAVKIFGPDLNTLTTLGNTVKAEMSKVDGMVDVSMEQMSQSPRLTVKPKPEMFAAYGLTPAAFSTWLSSVMSGLSVGQVRENGFAYDLVLTLGDIHSQKNPMEYLRDIPVDTPKGRVPLYYLCDVVSELGADQIKRENVSRCMTVSANVEGRDVGSAAEEIQHIVTEKINLPEGYSVDFGGQAESQKRSSRTLAIASMAALLAIALLLYLEFHSTSQTLLILINLPLALIGAVFLLRVTYDEVNIPAIIGFISLMGISTRNGMLLLSRYNSLRDAGVPLNERIATGSRERLLPILMTALTSTLALVPLALRGDEPGNELQAPLAIVILGGLFSATLLNIYVVPALYRVIESRKNNSQIQQR